MNLNDYLKMSSALFGECAPQCDGCDGCRVAALVEQVWASGVRSGASATADRKKKAVLFSEWEWSSAVHQDLQDFALSRAPEGMLTCRGDAELFVSDQLGAAQEWAGATKEIRKLDWTLFMKKWLRKELTNHKPTAPRQGGLFSSPSTPASPASRKADERQSAFDKAMELNSKPEQGSRWSTCADGDSNEMLVELQSSPRTSPRSH